MRDPDERGDEPLFLGEPGRGRERPTILHVPIEDLEVSR